MKMDAKEVVQRMKEFGLKGVRDGSAHLFISPDLLAEFVQSEIDAARKDCKRKLMIDLWDALPGHEATGDMAGSLRAMLMLSDVGDEIKTRSNAIVSGLPRKGESE